MRRMDPVMTWAPPAIARWIALLAVWILIAGASPADLPAGMIAAALASWASLTLHPPRAQRARPVPLIRLGLNSCSTPWSPDSMLRVERLIPGCR